MLYGNDWKAMQHLIKTRTLVQIRTHAQKVFKKVGQKRLKKNIGDDGIGLNGLDDDKLPVSELEAVAAVVASVKEHVRKYTSYFTPIANFIPGSSLSFRAKTMMIMTKILNRSESLLNHLMDKLSADVLSVLGVP